MSAFRARFGAFVALAAIAACSSTPSTSSPAPDAGDPRCAPFTSAPAQPLASPPIHTPRWAFEPWLSKDYSSSDDTRAFVHGSLDRGIPVGVAVLDSPWETNYNTFVPDESAGRYAGFDAMVADLTSVNVRLVVWITQFENSSSFDIERGSTTHYDPDNPPYDLGEACGFFVESGRDFGWYKGEGGSLDFFDPAAVAWWRSLQDALLARGISGYKIDFGDAYMPNDPVDTAAGPEPHQAYSEAYYKELYDYATTKKSGDFVTMVRGWDVSYGFAPRTYARPENAPVVWAGDNRRDWVGVVDALNTTFMSATLGYVDVGTDLGGYLDHDDTTAGLEIPFDLDVFQRWTAMSALSPFMQLHSREDYMPWTVPDPSGQTVVDYKYWANLHHALVPFFYSLAEESYAKRASGIVRPIGDASAWAGDFRYTLGDAFLVAPILDATGKRDVALPAGALYYDWFAPAADPVEGGKTVTGYDATDRAKYPLFVKGGAIVPLHVDSDAAGLGDATSSDAWTILVYPAASSTSFVLYEDDDTTTTITANLVDGTANLALERATKPILARVRVDTPVTRASVNGAPAASVASFAELTASSGAAWFSDGATRSAWVRVPKGSGQVQIAVSP